MTVYFTKAEFRNDMRCPTSAARAHAVCRRLTGTATQYPSPWYGAHYWAACALLTDQPQIPEKIRFYRAAFAREMTSRTAFRVKDHCDPWPDLPKKYRLLFRLALRRVRAIRRAAMRLETSVAW